MNWGLPWLEFDVYGSRSPWIQRLTYYTLNTNKKTWIFIILSFYVNYFWQSSTKCLHLPGHKHSLISCHIIKLKSNIWAMYYWQMDNACILKPHSWNNIQKQKPISPILRVGCGSLLFMRKLSHSLRYYMKPHRFFLL